MSSPGLGLTGRPSIPEAPVIESKGRSVPDTPLEPVIGLAKGETGGGYDDQLRSDAVGAAYNQSCGSVGTSPEASTRSQPEGARRCCGRKRPLYLPTVTRLPAD